MHSDSSDVVRDGTPEGADSAATREVGAWLLHFSRTCKTCRLYDSNNPTVVRFREELYQGLRGLLERFGDLPLDVGARDISFGGGIAYRATSRDDNLAAVFHRDGIRRLTFSRDLGATELEAFLDLTLHVTGQGSGDDDLVTLLWETELPGITLVAAPVEGDVEGGAEEGGDDRTPLPWPGGGDPGPGAPAGGTPGSGPGEDGKTRSDDWDVLERFASLDEAFDDLESAAIHEMARLQDAYDSERTLPTITRILETVADCLATDATPGDREELARFLPRVLREAIAAGDWSAARTALGMLRTCEPEWSGQAFFDGLARDPSMGITRKAVAALDAQGETGVDAFLALAMDFGPAAIEWLMAVLSESQQQRTRRPLTRTLAALARPCPERLLPWMADERWYVVRNVVHILGWIGEDRVAGHLQAAIHHPETRVRREVVAALSGVSSELARPVLLSMLSSAEPRLFTAILHQLSVASDPVVSRRLIEMLRDDRFFDRSEDEQRAVYLALAGQGESVLEALREELHRGGLFARGRDAHLRSVARCIARIGSPSARETLEHGFRSSRGATRKACELALASIGSHDD